MSSNINSRNEPTEGGGPSNTHPPTSNGIPLESYPGAFVTGGYDWLTCTFGVRWNPSRLATLAAWLEEAKRQAQVLKRGAVLTQVPEFGNIVVSPSSFIWGGPKGTRLEFNLHVDGTNVGLSRKLVTTHLQPNIVVNQTGTDCLIRGGRERYEYMCDTIAALGCHIEWVKVSRADLAADIAGLGVEVMQDLFEADHFVTRANMARPFANKVSGHRTGFSVGRAPCYLTVYDKLHEVIRKKRTEYINAMLARRWGGALPTHATGALNGNFAGKC